MKERIYYKELKCFYCNKLGGVYTDDGVDLYCEKCNEHLGDIAEVVVICVDCGKAEWSEAHDIQICSRCAKKYDLEKLWEDHDADLVDALDFNESKAFRNKYLKRK